MITLALIGVGRWGKNIINESQNKDSLRIKYLCSPHIYEKRIQGKFELLTDYKQLKDREDLDGVIIATPPSTHFEILLFFLKHNINIFVEKPFVSNIDEARYVEKKLKRKKIVFKIGFVYLYSPAFLKIVELSKNLEDINEIIIELGNVEEMQYGPLTEWGPHAVSMLSKILPEYPNAIKAESLKDGKMLKLFFYYKAIRVLIIIGGGFKHKKRKIQITTKDKTFLFDELAERKVLCTLNNMNKKYYGYSRKSALRQEIYNFIKSIKNNTYENDIEMGMRVAKMLHYANNSLQNHGKIIKLSA